MHGQNPQWPYFRAYQAAANRMTMLMRGGRHVAPAIMLDTSESEWPNRGVDLYCSHRVRDDFWKSCKAMSQAHVDFDLIPYYVFSDAAHTTFDEDRIRIGKEDYLAVVLSGVEFIPAAVVERLREFYDAGGIVVALNRVPNASCNGQEDERVRAAVEGIWGTNASTRGKSAITNDDGLEACLAGLGVPDVRIPSELKNLLYCHRRLHGKDLYFFANTGADPIATIIELRDTRGAPSLWDPVSGEINESPSYSTQDGELKLLLHLGEYESVFVVVDPNAAGHESVVNIPTPVSDIVLQNPWKVRNGADDYHRIFSTEVQLPNDWPAGSPARLELRGASQIMRLKVNGKPVGQRFCSPYNFEVGDYLRPGDNRIEIERIGRYSSPVEITNLGKNSYTDDKTAVVPCQRAILVLRAESGRETQTSGEPSQ